MEPFHLLILSIAIMAASSYSSITGETETTTFRATVTGIDSTKKYPVREDVNLAGRKVSEKVVIRSNDVYEITLKNP